MNEQTTNQNIVFPKEIFDTLKKVYSIEESDALSEIDFAVSAIDKNTQKRTFTIIHYEVEDSTETFEIYVCNDRYFIDYLGDETEYPLIKSYDFDNDTRESHGTFGEVVI